MKKRLSKNRKKGRKIESERDRKKGRGGEKKSQFCDAFIFSRNGYACQEREREP